MLLALRILSCVIYGFTGFFLILGIFAYWTPDQISDDTALIIVIVAFISAILFAYLGFRIHIYWKTTLSKMLIIGFPILVVILGIIPQSSTAPIIYTCESEELLNQVKDITSGEQRILDIYNMTEVSNSLHESGNNELVCNAQFVTTTGDFIAKYQHEVQNDQWYVVWKQIGSST